VVWPLLDVLPDVIRDGDVWDGDGVKGGLEDGGCPRGQLSLRAACAQARPHQAHSSSQAHHPLQTEISFKSILNISCRLNGYTTGL
jgi:hypothetical protein